MNVATIGKANIYSSYLTEESQTPTNIFDYKSDKNPMLDISYVDGNWVIKTSNKLKLSVFSLTGQVLWSGGFDPNGAECYTIPGIPVGCYILSVKTGDFVEQNARVLLNKTSPYDIIFLRD